MNKFLLPILVILLVLPFLQARSQKLKKVLAQDDGTEELDFEEGYVASFSQKQGEQDENEEKALGFNEMSSNANCINCRIRICKVRLVFKEKCIIILGKKICIKVPVLEFYDCKYVVKCVPELICKRIGTPI